MGVLYERNRYKFSEVVEYAANILGKNLDTSIKDLKQAYIVYSVSNEISDTDLKKIDDAE